MHQHEQALTWHMQVGTISLWAIMDHQQPSHILIWGRLFASALLLRLDRKVGRLTIPELEVTELISHKNMATAGQPMA